jgi:hypothetical protein
VVVAVDESRGEAGCPAQVTSEQRLSSGKNDEKRERLTTDPVYSELFLRSRVGPVGLDVVETKKIRDAGTLDDWS